ncbi:MAG: lysophospholipid acyltransferase family protein [Pyrinomonadaceae bacterium]|nr:lysophospholipid acyltransferase family protein [Pyrinomonadaceae bacterium]
MTDTENGNLQNLIKRRGRLRTYAEYSATWAILKSMGVLPRSVSVKTGQAVGSIAHTFLPRLRRHAEINLKIAFPEMDDAARQRIIRGTFKNLGRLLGEVSQFPRFNPANISSVTLFDKDDNETFRRIQREGRGIILLTGHIGAWELLAYAQSIEGNPISFLARPIDNPLVNRLVTDYRTRYGNRILEKRGSAREVLRTLKSGGMVGILADLNSTREAGVFCDFFGVQACTTSSIATLALRTGATVFPVYIVWDEKAQIHKLYGGQPVETVETGDFENDVKMNTARYTKVIEDIIRRYPEQWLWIHRRWRTRPEGEPEIY